MTLKAAYLTALGFDTANWEYAQFGQCTAGKWCVQPNVTVLHNSPAKPCPVEPTLTAAVKKIDKKLAEFTFTNNTTSSQLLTNLSLAWPQATNGNLLSVKMDGTLIYSTSTASPLNTSTFLANTTAKRTIAAGDSVVLQFNFTNNVDKTASNYTGSATFDPFGAVSFP